MIPMIGVWIHERLFCCKTSQSEMAELCTSDRCCPSRPDEATHKGAVVVFNGNLITMGHVGVPPHQKLPMWSEEYLWWINYEQSYAIYEEVNTCNCSCLTFQNTGTSLASFVQPVSIWLRYHCTPVRANRMQWNFCWKQVANNASRACIACCA